MYSWAVCALHKGTQPRGRAGPDLQLLANSHWTDFYCLYLTIKETDAKNQVRDLPWLLEFPEWETDSNPGLLNLKPHALASLPSRKRLIPAGLTSCSLPLLYKEPFVPVGFPGDIGQSTYFHEGQLSLSIS